MKENNVYKHRHFQQIMPLNNAVENIKINKKEGKKIALYITEGSNCVSSLYRADNMAEALLYSDKWFGTVIGEYNQSVIFNILDYIDVVIFVRCFYRNVCDLIEHLRQKNIPCLYDIDDYNYDSSCDVVFERMKIKNSFDWLFDEYRSAIDICDGYITSTVFLLDCVSQCKKKSTWYVHNFVNDVQNAYSDYLWGNIIKNINGFRCGFLGTGEAHYIDLERIAKQVVEFFNEYEDTVFVISSKMLLPDDFKGLSEAGRIEIVPYTDIVNMIDVYANLDINMIPLADNEFAYARSELKWVEALLSGTPSIATDTPLYREVKKVGYDVELVNNNEWYEGLSKFYRKRMTRERIGRNRHMIQREYVSKVMTEKLESVLDSVMEEFKYGC